MAEATTTSTPLPVYTVDKGARPEAIVIHCSDPRFQAAFERFIHDELHLAHGQYIPIIVGGGGGVLAHPERLPKEFKFIRERIEHYRHGVFPTAVRLVIINHEGCRYYGSLKQRALGLLGSKAALAAQPHEDLSAVGRIFARLLPHLGLTIEPYYAHFTGPQENEIVFEKVKV